jgi:indolepyruvate ferredoxin oxidoreductase, beta subunit
VSARRTSVVVVGVAGQPVLEAARLVGRAALAAGLDVSLTEDPPALEGGGATAAHVRFGEDAGSPCIADGEADVLVALEQIEALRAARLLAPGAFAAVNERLVPIWRMRAALEEPPRDVVARLRAAGVRAVGVRAEALVRRPPSDALVATALLGVVAAALPLPDSAYAAALADPPDSALSRWRAFERGRRLFAALPDRLAGGARGGAA